MLFSFRDYKPELMFKKIILFLFFLTLLSLVNSTIAFEPFVKSQGNPLPFTNDFPDWNEIGQYQPSVIFDNGEYKMWYASTTGSKFKIIYAISADGISWGRQNLLDVYPGFDNHDPAILKTQNGYTLFFVASVNATSQTFKIFKIESNDGANFDLNSRQLVLQPAGSLESTAISSPSVIYENGSYHLFYLCWGSQGFRVCQATSQDGTQWQRCQNNPIINEVSDGPNVFAKDGKHYLFFQSPLGVRLAESSDNLSCTTNWSNFQTVLPEPIIGPSILDLQNSLFLYYSGFYQTGIKISLATSGEQISPTPTLNPTLTPSPSPTPVIHKIIIIPGLMSSWNKEAMLHNKKVSQTDWKLLPFVKEYYGLIQSLQNLGYTKDEDFFIFAYDWRKNLDNIADDLKQFISAHNLTSSQIDLIGHSLGGLVGRIYGQKNGSESFNRLITVGSPHQGTANVYKLVEAGDFDKDDTMIWLMQKLVFFLNRKHFETNKKTIQTSMPVAKDLFPVYDFLTDKNGDQIAINSMKIKNDTLLDYQPEFPQIFNSLTTIAGDKTNKTLSGYKVQKRSNLDKLLDIYPDGRPSEKLFTKGDYVIVEDSALAGNDRITLHSDHGELIYKKASIESILGKLNIAYSSNQIVEGNATKISPSLIFTLRSPAEMEVSFGSQKYIEQDGLIFIENAEAGNYNLKIKGEFPGGRYTVLVGQISDTDDKWFEIDGEINKLLPFLQTDTYTITFNPENLLDFPVNQNDIVSLFNLLIQRLTILKKDYSGHSLNEAIEEVEEAKSSFQKSDSKKVRKQLLECLDEIFEARKKASTILRNELYDTLIQLENLFEKSLENETTKPTYSFLQNELPRLKKKYESSEDWLLQKKQKGTDVTDKAVVLNLTDEKLTKATNYLKDQNLHLTEIVLESANGLLKEIR